MKKSGNVNNYHVPLDQYIERMLQLYRESGDQKRQDQENLFDAKLNAVWTRSEDRFVSDAEARAIAAHTVKDKLEDMNNLRRQLDQQALTFAPKDFVNDRFRPLETFLQIAVTSAQLEIFGRAITSEIKTVNADLDKRLKDLENFQSNLTGRLAIIGGIYAVIVIVVVAIIIRALPQ